MTPYTPRGRYYTRRRAAQDKQTQTPVPKPLDLPLPLVPVATGVDWGYHGLYALSVVATLVFCFVLFKFIRELVKLCIDL